MDLRAQLQSLRRQLEQVAQKGRTRRAQRAELHRELCKAHRWGSHGSLGLRFSASPGSSGLAHSSRLLSGWVLAPAQPAISHPRSACSALALAFRAAHRKQEEQRRKLEQQVARMQALQAEELAALTATARALGRPGAAQPAQTFL